MDMSVNANAAQAAAQLPIGSTQSNGSAATGKVAAVDPTDKAKPKPERKELEAAVKSIQDFADSTQRNLKFSIDEKSHQVVVKVIATQTGVVVRQIPDEAAVKLAQRMSETGSLILDEQV
jgi:flagellar protein FlaG